MASLPENATYGNTGSVPPVPVGKQFTAPRAGSIPTPASGFTYKPNNIYKNLANLKATGSPFATPSPAFPGTPAYQDAKQAGIAQYGQLVNKGQGIPTETPFLPPLGDPNASIPVPQDYGTFMSPTTIDNSKGEKLSWGTPQTPVIKNIQGDVPGQFVQDTSNPNLLVKTNRGSNPIADQAIHDGRPGFMYQIDHIMPLELGGADTLANRELLTSDQNDAKTKAQAIPYTLYAHGDISLDQARTMAMQWKNRDLTDVPEPNGIGLVSDAGGKTGIQIARDVAHRWSQPAVPTLKDKIGQIPQAMKDLGKGFMPDPVREFLKGALSGATLGFLGYQQGENEGMGSKVAGIAGMAIGGLASFMLGGELLDLGLAGVGIAGEAFQAYRGVATAEAMATGFAEAATATEGIAEGAKAAETTFKSLNQAPGYLKNLLTPETLTRAAKFGATSAIVGQGQQFVANKFNPYTLSGKGLEKDQGVAGTIGNIFKDMSIGAVAGIGSPTIKGTAYAAMLPLTLSFIANPDDPATAITNGVIFGAMHGIGTMGEPGYNNIEAFGGKPYENPVAKSFETTVNKAAYASLGNYAPDIFPQLQPGETVPLTAHSAETVQQAKDLAIKNIWSRFLTGKDAPSEVQAKTLADFNKFSNSLDTTLDAKKPELSLLDKFSLGKRKEVSTETRAQNAAIKDQFGKGYQDRNVAPGMDASGLADSGMDLQTALTEVKRVTVAARQLYKGGLVGDARNMADVNDLLSFGKAKLQGRFDAQEKFMNPPIVKQAVDSIDQTFMKNSFANNRGEASGQYPTGDAAITGAALTINKATAKYFFDQKAAGNASPNILLVDRSDTAPLWRMKNQLLDPKDIASKSHAPDPNPENALQAFGIVQDPKTGQKSLVPLGWMASDFRLNEATNPNNRAFNQHPAVLKYTESGGMEGLKPLDLHKDQIAPAMRKEGISVLVANLDPRATFSTKESQNPFVPINLNDQNWEYSKKLGDRLSQQENTNPISMAVSKVSNAIDAKQKSAAIAEMNKNIVKPASDYIPKPAHPVTPELAKTDTVVVPREMTRTLIQQVESSLEVADPSQLKAAFQKNFGMLLPDEQATEIFNSRNSLTLRQGVKLLVDAVNSGNADAATRIKLNFAKTYLESGALQSTEGGKAVPDMNILGKMKNVPSPAQISSISPPITPPETPVDISIKPNAQTPPVASDGQTGALADKIVANAQREFLNIKKSPVSDMTANTPPATKQAQELSKYYIPQGMNALEDAKARSAGYQEPDHEAVMADMNKVIQTDLQRRNVPPSVIDEVQQIVGAELKNRSNLISNTKEGTMVPYDLTPEDLLHPNSDNDIFKKLVKRDDGSIKPAITRDEAAKYFKSKGYAFEDPAYDKLGTGKDVKVPSLFDEEGNPSEVLKELNKFMPKGTDSIPRPKFVAREFYKSINDNVKSDNPQAKYIAEGFDLGLKSIVGPNYQNDPYLPKILADYFRNVFFSDTNSAGKEIMQNKDIVNARGRGERENNLYGARNQQLLDNPTGEGGGLTESEVATLGLESGGEGNGFSGMNVRPIIQDENMVHDLTRGEDLMAALFSDTQKGAATSLRAIRKLFLGYGKEGTDGLRAYILDNHPGLKGKSPGIPFDENSTAMKKAVAFDQATETKATEEKAKVAKAKEEMDKLKGQSETIANMIKGFRENPDEPLPAGLTENMLEGNLGDIMKKIEKYTKIIDATKKDGKGGPGSFFGAIWDKLKNGNTYTYTFPEKAKPAVDTKKFLAAIAQNETSVVKGDPYSTWQPSGNPKMGKALGKYRVTEASLKEHAPNYIGRPVTTKEFLSSPGLQDQYMTGMATKLSQQDYTPQQIADIHRSGTTLENGYKNQDYVNKFNSTYSPTPAMASSPSTLANLGK